MRRGTAKCATGVAGAMLAVAITSPALAVPIYGGLTYDPATGTGYEVSGNSGVFYLTGANPVVEGTAVGNVIEYVADSSKGSRAVRWDASGSVVILDHLGFSSSGLANSTVRSINNARTAVGVSQKYTEGDFLGDRAVRWEASGAAVTELGNLGTTGSGVTRTGANAINDAGIIVGSAEKYDAGVSKGQRAVRWDASDVEATELGNLGTDSLGNTFSSALNINQSGTIVGSADKYVNGVDLGYRAVRWDASGTAAIEMGNLGTDSNGYTYARAHAINEAGVAVGHAAVYEGGVAKGMHGVRWDASGNATKLNPLSINPRNGEAISEAIDVNSSGTAVGYGTMFYPEFEDQYGYRAVRWDASDASATELGRLGTNSDGGTETFAYAINDAGVAVGYAWKFDEDHNFLGTRAVAWGPDGLPIELNTLLDPDSGWTNLVKATGISNDGWITGTGYYDPDGPGGEYQYKRVFLLNLYGLTIPEPGSLVLLGVVHLVLLTRRRYAALN